MQTTREIFEHAGKISQQQSYFSDEDLKVIVKTMGLTLAFLNGRGQKWFLATTLLRRELDVFERFVESRKSFRKN